MLMIDNTIKYILDNIERLDQLRLQDSSTKKFQNKINDSNSVSVSLNLLSNIAVTRAYIDTAYTTKEWMDINEIALGDIENLAMRAHNLAPSSMSDVIDLTSLQEIKTEFESILHRVIDLVNSHFNGDFIFGGTRIHSEPFSLNGPPFSVTYNGNDNEIIRNLGPNERVIININGRIAFTDLFTSLIGGINAPSISELDKIAGELQKYLVMVNKARSLNGARQRHVLALIEHGEETDYFLQTLLSKLEDVSIIEAITNLQQQEFAYQTVLEVASRTLVTINLFD